MPTPRRSQTESQPDGRRRKRKSTSTPRRKSNGVFWLWVVPLGTCVLFAVLIGGAFVTRQVIVMVRGAPAEVDAAVPADDREVANTAAPAPVPPAAVALPESSEPGYEVLPPAPYRQHGRQLRKMLIVGPGAGMFPALHDALEHIIPGDIVEIRTNGPLLLDGIEIKFREKTENPPLTIRAGQGFAPVIRVARLPANLHEGALRLSNVPLQLQGLHVVTRGEHLAVLQGGSVTASDCSFTLLTDATPSRTTFHASQNKSSIGRPIALRMTRCLFRGIGVLWAPAQPVSIECEQCAFVHNRSTFAFAFTYEHSIVLNRCTACECYFIDLFGPSLGSPPVPSVISINNSLIYNPWCCSPLITLRIDGKGTFSKQDHLDLLRTVVSRMNAETTLAQFWEGWIQFLSSTSHDHFRSGMYFDADIPGVPQLTKGIDMGPRIRRVIGDVFGGDRNAAARLNAMLPEDLIATSKKRPDVAALLASGAFGCDLRLLPIPPQTTVEFFEIQSDDPQP